MSKPGRAVLGRVFLAAGISMLASCTHSAKPEPALDRGRTLFYGGKFNDAETELRKAIVEQPSNPEAHYLLSLALSSRPADEVSEEAQDEMYQAIKLKQDFLDARVRLAHIMIRRNDPDNQKWGGEWAEKELAAAPNGQYSAEARRALAILNFRQHNAEAAVEQLKQALQVKPGSVSAASVLALEQLTLGDLAGAVRTVTALPPGAEAFECQGELYRLIGDAPKAEECFRKSLRLDPNYPEAAANLVDTILAQGQTSPEVESALARLYAMPDLRFQHLHPLFMIRAGRRNQGLKELEELSNRNPADDAPRIRWIAAMAQNGQSAETMRLLGEGLVKRPAAIAYALRATFQAREKRLVEARADIQAGLALGSRSPQLLYASALVQNLNGEPSRSRDDLTEAIAADGSYIPARLDLVRMMLAEHTFSDSTNEDDIARASGWNAALNFMNSIPRREQRVPTVVLLRNWLLLISGERDLARRSVRSAGLSGPDAAELTSALQGNGSIGKLIASLRTKGSYVLTPFSADGVMQDLLEFPAGPVFAVFDLKLIDYMEHPKENEWLVF